MKREHLTEDELMAALRQHEVSELGSVELAMLEIDGSIDFGFRL